MKLTAQDVMTRHVITVSADTQVEDAAAQLARHRITGLPVLDTSGSVIGMISDFDVIGKQGRLVKFAPGAERRHDAPGGNEVVCPGHVAADAFGDGGNGIADFLE